MNIVVQITVPYGMSPSKGRRVKDEISSLDLDLEGKRAVFDLCHEGIFTKRRQRFVFPDDVVKATSVPTDIVKKLSKIGAYKRGSQGGVSNVSPLLGHVLGRIEESAQSTDGIVGMLIFYHNEKGADGAFCVIAEATTIASLRNILPADKFTELPSRSL